MGGEKAHFLITAANGIFQTAPHPKRDIYDLDVTRTSQEQALISQAGHRSTLILPDH
jgi:hypothetical protein